MVAYFRILELIVTTTLLKQNQGNRKRFRFRKERNLKIIVTYLGLQRTRYSFVTK